MRERRRRSALVAVAGAAVVLLAARVPVGDGPPDGSAPQPASPATDARDELTDLALSAVPGGGAAQVWASGSRAAVVGVRLEPEAAMGAAAWRAVTLTRDASAAGGRGGAAGTSPAWRVAAMDGAAQDPPGTSVAGDQEQGAIVGRGDVLLPDSFAGDPGVRRGADACPGCSWMVRPACGPEGDLCVGALVGCQVGETRFVLLLRRPPSTDYVVVGTVCLGAGASLLSPGALGDRVAEEFVDLLPRARPSMQPSVGALVNQPSLFASGEPRVVGPYVRRIAGREVTIRARAEWVWRFGDGEVLVTSSPGGRYPDRSVEHAFTRPGPRTVTVTTRWFGEYGWSGSAAYPIPGTPIELEATLPVDVREARARLLAD